jgi:hypothetical protein
VESTPGVGTVFTILIPVEATSPAPGRRTPDASVAAAAQR